MTTIRQRRLRTPRNESDLAPGQLLRHLIELVELINRELFPALVRHERALTQSVATITESATMGVLAQVVLVDASSGAVTLTILGLSDWWRRLTVKKIDSSANAVTIVAADGANIDGSASYSLVTQYESVDLVVDSAQAGYWVI